MPSDSEVLPADAVFDPVDSFEFDDVSTGLERRLARRFEGGFDRLAPVDVAVKRVATDSGIALPIRVVAVTYNLPEDVPIEALAYEIGREFLGATPTNSSGTLGGNGIYIRDRKRGHFTESVAFFIGKETFVYAFGATVRAPTEKVARALLHGAIST